MSNSNDSGHGPTAEQYEQAKESMRQTLTFFPCAKCHWPVMYNAVFCSYCGHDPHVIKKVEKKPKSEFIRQVEKLRDKTDAELKTIWESIGNDPESSSPHIKFYESEDYTMQDWAMEVYSEMTRRECSK